MTDPKDINQLIGPTTRPVLHPYIVAAAYAIPIIVVFVSPLAAPALLLVIAVLLAIGAKLTGEPIMVRMQPGYWYWVLIAFALWALVSAIWSPDPKQTATKACLLALFASACLAAFAFTTSIGAWHHNRTRAVGIGVAFALVTLWVAIEVVTNQYVTRQLLELFPDYAASRAKHITWRDGRIVELSPTNINRRIALITLLYWPIIIMLWTLPPPRWRLWVIGLSGICLLGIIAASHHQSSQVAIAASALVFAAALVSSRLVRYGLATGLCLVLVVVVPLAKVPMSQGWHLAPWLFQSARERVVIWNYVATKTLERPIIGIGADASPTIKRKPQSRWLVETSGRTINVQNVRHPHNAYLQVWYESGAIGAILMALLGIAGLSAIARLNRIKPHRLGLPALYAHATVILALPAFSYSLWQPWLQAAMLLSIIIAAIALYSQPQDDGDGTSHTL